MHIAFVAYDRMTALDLIGPMEVPTRIPGTTSELVATRPDTFIADGANAPFALQRKPSPADAGGSPVAVLENGAELVPVDLPQGDLWGGHRGAGRAV